MSELTRRMNERIYDEAEYSRALAWTKANCPEDVDRNKPETQRSREQKDRDWETVVKMAMIARDLLTGNPRLAEIGYGEEALGHNAILGGFQGQRQWTDHFPNGDFMEAILNSSFDWNGIRAPYVFATENDSLNGAVDAAGLRPDEPAPDLRRRADVLEPRGGEAGHGRPAGGPCCGRRDPPDQQRRGDARRHRADGGRWPAGDEAVLGDQRGGGPSLPEGDNLVPGDRPSTSAVAASPPTSCRGAACPSR